MAAAEHLDWQNIRKICLDSLNTLIQFLKNPITGMRQLPDWSWIHILILSGALSAVCGVVSGIISQRLLGVFSGIVVYPVSVIMMTIISAGFFYYVFFFFYKREVDFRKLFINLVFASIPSTLVSTVSPLLPPATLIGIAMTCLLLVVGFVENFGLPKKSMTKLMGGIFLIYVIIWIASTISFEQKKDQFRMKHSPESLDILEKELGN